VLLVEGRTEAIVYGRVKSFFLDGECPSTVEEIDGLFNVNKKILHALKTRHTDRQIRAYCCLDRESRYAKTPEFDLGLVQSQVAERGMSNVLSVDAIIATKMIESWFFYDLPGIYTFLRVPKAKRNVRAFKPPEAYDVSDLKALFRRHGKTYREGERARHFINRLNVPGICRNCKELGVGVALILERSRVG
jgi:hypothetical protein